VEIGRSCRDLSRIGLACLIGAGLSTARAEDVLRVGSKRFTESYVLGAILARAAASAARVEYREGLGNTAILFAALKQGGIDLYPEYTGTIAAEILRLPPDQASIEVINSALHAFGLGAGVPFGFNNTYAIAVREELAAAKGLSSISDLAGAAGLRIGLSQEFLGRADGWPGLARRYGLPQVPIALDHGLAYEAIAANRVDAIDAYSTDAKIKKYRLHVLRDDRRYFPRYEALVLYRLDVPQRFPKAWQAVTSLAGSVDESRMIEMNGEVELGHRSFASVAADFLGAQNTSRASSGLWSKLVGDDFWRLTWQHVRLVLASVGLATLAGVPLGVAAALRPTAGNVILAVTGALQTIPALALLAMLIPLVGTIGTLPALIALFLYALLPIVRNACVGVREIPSGMRLAALALGLSTWHRVRYIDLPLAMPVVLAGVKTAAILSVGTATIAAFIGAGGYGERISVGLALNDYQMLWAGAIPAAALAILTQGAFELTEHLWRRKHSGS
jgi:osmoprotectant transport system permease protein